MADTDAWLVIISVNNSWHGNKENCVLYEITDMKITHTYNKQNIS